MLITISTLLVTSWNLYLAFVQGWSLPSDRPIHFWLLTVPICYFLKPLSSFVSVFLFFIGSFLPFSFGQPLPLRWVPLFAESRAPSLFLPVFISFASLFAPECHIIPFQNPKRAVQRHIPVCRITLYWTWEDTFCSGKCILPLCPNLQQRDLTNNWAIGESVGIQTPSVNHKVHNKVSN